MKITWPVVTLVAVVIICSTVVACFASDNKAALVIPLFVGLLAPAVGSIVNSKQTSDVSAKVDRVLNGEMEDKIAGVMQQHVPDLVKDALTTMLNDHLDSESGNDSVTDGSNGPDRV